MKLYLIDYEMRRYLIWKELQYSVSDYVGSYGIINHTNRYVCVHGMLGFTGKNRIGTNRTDKKKLMIVGKLHGNQLLPHIDG